jgi:hypothetical protein
MFQSAVYRQGFSCMDQFCELEGREFETENRREKDFSPRVNSRKSSIERRKERNSRQGGNRE